MMFTILKVVVLLLVVYLILHWFFGVDKAIARQFYHTFWWMYP